MKRFVCISVLALIGGLLLWFLKSFTEADSSINYIEWNTAEKIFSDGTSAEIPVRQISSFPEIGESYRFTAEIGEGHSGELLFELSGMEISVEFNGEKYLDSVSVPPSGSAVMPRTAIPLASEQSGTLTVVCRILNTENILFPPLPRFVGIGFNESAEFAYANYYAFKTGAAALAAVLVAGLFVMGIARGSTDFKLIPLFITAILTAVHWISVGMGRSFMPEKIAGVLSWDGLEIAALLAMGTYIVMNRRSSFFKRFGILSAICAAALMASYVFSLITDGRVSRFINSEIMGLVNDGYFSGLIYYLTFGIMLICTAVAAYEGISFFVEQKAENQALELKNRLALDGYHAMEQKLKADAEARHEFSHNITALYALWQSGDNVALGNAISELKAQNALISQTQFTENFTINAILQDVSSKAVRAGIKFEAQVRVPSELDIPETDLCRLLMNMLDNALEAASENENGFVRFSAEVRNGFLAVKCENSFSHDIKRDENGNLISTKDVEYHGLGIRLMSKTAERYGSIVDISVCDDKIFTVQTALKLPESKK